MPSNLFEEQALNETRLFFGDRDAEYREKLKVMTFSADASSDDAADFVQRITEFITIVNGLEESQLGAERASEVQNPWDDELQFHMDLGVVRGPGSFSVSENDSLLADSQPEELDEEEADSEPPINLVELSLFAFSYFRIKYIDLFDGSSQQSMLGALNSLHDLCSKLIVKDASENARYSQIRAQNNEFLAKQASESLVQNPSVTPVVSPSTPPSFVKEENASANVELPFASQMVEHQKEVEENAQVLIALYDDGFIITGNSLATLEAKRRIEERKSTESSDEARNGFSSESGSDLASSFSFDILRSSDTQAVQEVLPKLSRPHKIVQWAQLGMIVSYIGMIISQSALDNPSAGLETATTVGSIAMPAIMLFLACSDYCYWSEVSRNNNPDLAEKKEAAKFTPLIPCLFLVANALKFAVDEHAVDAVLYSVLILIGVFKGLASNGDQNSEQNNSAIKKFGTGLLVLAFAGGILNSAVTAWSQQTLISSLQIPGGGFMDAMSQAGPIISGAFLVAVGVSIALKAYDTYQLHDKGIASDYGALGAADT
jgi:hypothetical protein